MNGLRQIVGQNAKDKADHAEAARIIAANNASPRASAFDKTADERLAAVFAKNAAKG